MEWRRIVAGTLLAALASSCAQPAATTPAAGGSGLPSAAILGRSVCPGAVPQVATNLRGPVADELERLGGLYQDQPGVLAVVWDGHQGVVVVEAGRLDAWRLRLAGRGVAVAPSCIDPTLLATAQGAMATIPTPNGTIISAGYDGLADAISVSGVRTDVLLDAMEAIRPGAKAAARAAIADGTLRVSEDTMVDGSTP